MPKKEIILIVVYFTFTGLSHSQDYHFSGFLNNMVFINPGYSALAESPEILMTYRNQWPGIGATFVTYGVTYTQPITALSSFIGVNFINDDQGGGVITRTAASLFYCYELKINKDWQVAGGIQGTYVFKKFNADELVFKSDILNELGYSYSPVNLGNYTKNYPDFGVGFVVKRGTDFSFGLAASHITRPDESLSSDPAGRLPVKYTAYIRGKIFKGGAYSGSNITFEPAMYFSHQLQNDELMWGSQVLISSKFVAAGWARQNLKFNFSDIVLSAGFLFNQYNFFYSYDVNVKKINILSTKMAAHEVTFLYRFEYKRKKIKEVKCPAY